MPELGRALGELWHSPCAGPGAAPSWVWWLCGGQSFELQKPPCHQGEAPREPPVSEKQGGKGDWSEAQAFWDTWMCGRVPWLPQTWPRPALGQCLHSHLPGDPLRTQAFYPGFAVHVTRELELDAGTQGGQRVKTPCPQPDPLWPPATRPPRLAGFSTLCSPVSTAVPSARTGEHTSPGGRGCSNWWMGGWRRVHTSWGRSSPEGGPSAWKIRTAGGAPFRGGGGDGPWRHRGAGGPE